MGWKRPRGLEWALLACACTGGAVSFFSLSFASIVLFFGPFLSAGAKQSSGAQTGQGPQRWAGEEHSCVGPKPAWQAAPPAPEWTVEGFVRPAPRTDCAPRLLGDHLQHDVALSLPDQLRSAGMGGDRNVVDRHDHVPLHEQFVGGEVRVDLSDPWMALVPLVVTLKSEALSTQRRGVAEFPRAGGAGASAPISCPGSVCSERQPFPSASGSACACYPVPCLSGDRGSHATRHESRRQSMLLLVANQSTATQLKQLKQRQQDERAGT